MTIPPCRPLVRHPEHRLHIQSLRKNWKYFMNRTEILEKYPNLCPGMIVYSLDGGILGTLLHLQDNELVVEKGIFFPHDFRARYDDIVEMRGQEVILAHHQDELTPWRDEEFGGWSNQVTRKLGVPRNPDETLDDEVLKKVS